MKSKRTTLTTVVLCLIVLLTAVLSGCGKKTEEDFLKDMVEFSTTDGSASIYLNKAWVVEDIGLDNCLCVGNTAGSQVALLMQSPKSGANKLVSSLDEMSELLKTSYALTGETTAEAPVISAMTNVSAISGTITVSGSNIGAYVVYGETDYAHYAILFGKEKINDDFITSAKASCSKFQENAPEEEDWTTAEVTDTIRWFNASYAVLTELNGWDYNRFAGLAANEESKALEQNSLKEWWSVTDRASADETLEWILTEGHRVNFATDMADLDEYGMADVPEEERASFLTDTLGMGADDAQFYANMYAMYAEFGPSAIDGWDYCRALNLMSFYYLAGYYTEQEALDKSLEIAQLAQPLFSSWDELVESYMRGYEYWAEESADERRSIYEDLKSRSDNPYAVDYNLSLTKTW